MSSVFVILLVHLQGVVLCTVKYEETKENEIGTEDKLNHNLYTLASLY